MSTLPRLKPPIRFPSLQPSGCRAPPPWLIARGGNAFSILSRRLRRRVLLRLRSFLAPQASFWFRTWILRAILLYGPLIFLTGLPLLGTTCGSTSSLAAASARCLVASSKKVLAAVVVSSKSLGRGRSSTVARGLAARRPSRAPSARRLRASTRRRASAFRLRPSPLASPRPLFCQVLSHLRLSPAPRPALLRLRLGATRLSRRAALSPRPAPSSSPPTRCLLLLTMGIFR